MVRLSGKALRGHHEEEMGSNVLRPLEGVKFDDVPPAGFLCTLSLYTAGVRKIIDR